MRVVTWNIGGGFISSNDDLVFNVEDIDYFVSELKAFSPDVVCLQEVHISKSRNQAEVIAKALGFKYFASEVIADSHVKSGEDLAVAIISRFPIVNSKFYLLPNPNLSFISEGKEFFSHDKGFLEANIEYDGVVVSVFSGHLLPFHRFDSDFMAEDFSSIRSFVGKIICEKADFVGADINFPRAQDLIPSVFEEGFKLAFSDHTITRPKGDSFDKILFSKRFFCSNHSVVQGRSDHFLCFADFNLKNNLYK